VYQMPLTATKSGLLGVIAVTLTIVSCSPKGSTTKAPSTTPRASATTATTSETEALVVAKNLAFLLGIGSPHIKDNVVAGSPCTDVRALSFCPINWVASLDGRRVALAGSVGRIAVADTRTHQIILNQQLAVSPPPEMVDRINAWISPDGRLVSTDVTTNYETIALGIWDVQQGTLELTNGPTTKEPWVGVDRVAFRPDENVLLVQDSGIPKDGATWSDNKIDGRAMFELHSYDHAPRSLYATYSLAEHTWIFLTSPDGYVRWTPPTAPLRTRFSACSKASFSAIDDSGEYFACAHGGTSVNGDPLFSEWSIQTKQLLVTFPVDPYGVIQQLLPFNHGGSIAVMAGKDTSQSSSKQLLIYDITPHLALRSTTHLPAISGGWRMQMLGEYIVATGFSMKGGNCCVVAVSTR
jgi:hypothetical protein